jgi:hypothetical protein
MPVTTNRREFLERLGAAAVVGALPGTAGTAWDAPAAAFMTPPEDWDLKWPDALKGKAHKAVFDCTEIENGYGVWRASIWENQYEATMLAKPGTARTVLVLRHKAVALALSQAFWDRFEIGKDLKAMHPLTEQPTDRNPALLSAPDLPEAMAGFALQKFIARGGIALACNLALQQHVEKLKAKDGVTDEEAQKRAVAMLVPGVILQPSGVFATVRAQQAGCVYVKAS